MFHVHVSWIFGLFFYLPSKIHVVKLFFSCPLVQLMVNWWFGLVVWDFSDKRNCYLRISEVLRIPNHQPKPLVDLVMCFSPAESLRKNMDPPQGLNEQTLDATCLRPWMTQMSRGFSLLGPVWVWTKVMFSEEILGWWNSIVLPLNLGGGFNQVLFQSGWNDPIWLISFKWLETTN